MKRILKILGLVILAIIAIGIFSSKDVPTTTSTQPPKSSTTETKTQAPPATINVDVKLTSGHYTAGIDIPSGKYNIVAIAGAGNVSSSNLLQGINAIMGTVDANKALGTNMYEQEYKNVRLDEGIVLSVSGVTIRITCDSASGKPLKTRNQGLTENYTLKNGHYTAGTDFPAGVYDITAVAGYGNVYSDNLVQGINAIMGTEDNPIASPERLFRNVALKKGTVLSVDGATVKISPSK